MVSFSRFSPIPSFPSFPGPHAVGTLDVELPIANLESPVSRPDENLNTISFRVFYPCEKTSPAGRPVRWIPHPQKEHLASSAKLMGAGSAASSISSHLLRPIYYVTIPARRNAQLLPPSTRSGTWSTMVFSHGLSGTSNGYSYLLGSIASHGVVVFAPFHHDGSAPVAYNRATDVSKSYVVPYKQIPHEFSEENTAARNLQLKIRMWELGLLHQAMLKLDLGDTLRNLDDKDGGDKALLMFRSRLNVHRPGGISWAGHSFGAATMAAFLKSVFYRQAAPFLDQDKQVVLFAPPEGSEIIRQVTPQSPVILLDPWMMPIRSESLTWLWHKPMPCYAPSGPGGAGILAVLSEAFFNWSSHLDHTKRLLSSSPSSVNISTSSSDPPPRFFYMHASAHPSQSDFSLMFAWISKTFFNAREPERLLRLNMRAMLQLLRENGAEVADSVIGAWDETPTDSGDDGKILRSDGGVRGWEFIPLSTQKKLSLDAEQPEKDGVNTPFDAAPALNEITA